MSAYIEIEGYEYWASYLINDDNSLEPEELAECQAWLAHNGVTASQCIDVGSDTTFEAPYFPGALPGTCAVYVFIKK